MNQDTAVTCSAKTKKGNVILAAVCDGMGGLEKGELASSTVIMGVLNWFKEIFPGLLYHNFTSQAVKDSLEKVITELNNRIRSYGEWKNIYLGTTMTVLLLVDDEYYICNVGDSRAYYLGNQIRQITKDQTFIQQELDMGRMTEEEALYSNYQNMLLQCIGVGTYVIPDFYMGKCEDCSTFLLCSDGFRHMLSKQEMWETLQPDMLCNEKRMEEGIKKLVELARSRGEKDDITVLLVHVIQEDLC